MHPGEPAAVPKTPHTRKFTGGSSANEPALKNLFADLSCAAMWIVAFSLA
jgi:hypothetical protein